MKNLSYILLIFFQIFISSTVCAQINYTKSEGNEYGAVIKFSPNGEFILSGGKNKIGIWFANTGKLSQTFSVKGAKDINDFAFLGNDTVLISGENPDIIIYDLKHFTVLGKLEGHSAKVTSLEINPDARQLFSSSMDHSTIVWDLNTNGVKKRFTDHKDFVLATAINQNTGSFASCGADGMVNVYNRSGDVIYSNKISEHWLWSIAFSLDGQSLVVGGDHHTYVVSNFNETAPVISALPEIKDRGYSLDFSADGKYFAVGTTHNNFYLFNWESKKLVIERKLDYGDIVDMDFDPNGKSMISSHATYKGIINWDLRSLNILPAAYFINRADRMPPEIIIYNQGKVIGEKVTVNTSDIELNGLVLDEYGVYKLMVNGVNTPVTGESKFKYKMHLAYGQNPVTLEAQDINRNIYIRRLTITRTENSGIDYDPATARNYLLVIGINNYTNWPRLHNAVNDANAIAGTLSGMYTFNFSDVTLITDSAATRNTIYDTLRSYIRKVGEADNFMVYFSGHGHLDDAINEGYWIPVDAEKYSIGSFISYSDILNIIKNINSKHTFLVADACYSGSIFNHSSRGYIENAEKYRSRWGFASGRRELVSDGEIGKNSPFAQSFLEFLRNNTQDKILVSDLIQYVKKKVPEMAGQTPIGLPLNNVGDDGGEFIFYKRH